ncbi:hypothetical protein J3459_010306 [Metarhizium acridum]|nr:hypothetical protein J3459_010306 [Metarhizium acridum]
MAMAWRQMTLLARSWELQNGWARTASTRRLWRRKLGPKSRKEGERRGLGRAKILAVRVGLRHQKYVPDVDENAKDTGDVNWLALDGAFAGSRRQQLERPMCWHLGPLIDSGWAHQALHFIFVSGINNSTDRPTASPTVRPSSQLPAFDRQLHCNRFGLFDLRAYPGPPQHPSTCLWSLQRQPPSPRLPRPLRLSVTKISVFERLPTSSTLSLLPTPVLKAPKLLEAFLLFGEPVFQPPISTSESYQLPHRRIPEVLPLTEEESRRPRQSTEGTVCHPFRPP